MQAVYTKVKHLLAETPRYRDNDKLLVARIWWEEMKAIRIDPETATARQLMDLMVDDRVTQPDTIKRARRKVQEDFPNLRGIVRTHRLQKQNKIQENIRNLNPWE
tara:strand:- start:82 stop:396 length:315 start_codon:yes stop_codon:yes gene_type:complete